MNQDNRHHEIRSPSMQSSNEPTQSNIVIQNLEAVPGLSGGRDVDQRQQNPCNDLQNEDRQRGAAEDIKPACRFPRDLVFGNVTDGCAKLQPQIEPRAYFFNQAHGLLPPNLIATGWPGVGSSPA